MRGILRAHKTRHHAAIIDPKEVGRLLRSIDAYPGSLVVSSALKIAPYVFVRPGELQQANGRILILKPVNGGIQPSRQEHSISCLWLRKS